MYKNNKFENFNTHALLKFVQEESVLLYSSNARKLSHSTKRFLTRRRDLSLARIELMGRLEKMDRNSPEFFPAGAIIWYEDKHEGVVVNNDGQDIYIKLSGEDFLIKVGPGDLILAHIKEVY